MHKLSSLLVFCTFFALPCNTLQAMENLSLSNRLHLPENLTLKIDHRTRYEGYDNAFKKATRGGDQILAFRTLVFLGLNYQNFSVGGEFTDSRISLEGRNTPVNTSLVNQTDLLQAYITWQSKDFLNSGLAIKVKSGRLTMDIGSRRLVARNRFRNTINNFTGLDSLISSANHWQWRNFVVLPVSRLPNDQIALRSDQAKFDEEGFERIFAGSFFSLNKLIFSSKGELYLFYLHEEDTKNTATKNRNLFTPGFRWFKGASPNKFDFEMESALQIGNATASSAVTDTRQLDHFAYFGHLSLGYSFNLPWQPHIILQYDYASGDHDPNDNTNNRFETLYGARRFEYGPTSIWGGFARANINSPGIRIKFKPYKNIKCFIAHRGYWLAEKKDTWVGGNLGDVSGENSGYLGQQLEMRIRWKAIPDTLNLETGWAHFFKGDFAKNAPDSPANKNDTDYFYLQTSIHIY